ncbi:hypothetical protein E3T35_10255 [Cryobacterium sp. TMT1-2-2]|nr:hypothetical protein E3T35_10255 [Cryobacterium sp. TMT1-2-2]
MAAHEEQVETDEGHGGKRGPGDVPERTLFQGVSRGPIAHGQACHSVSGRRGFWETRFLGDAVSGRRGFWETRFLGPATGWRERLCRAGGRP